MQDRLKSLRKQQGAKPAQPKPGQGQGKTKTTVTRDGKRTTTTTVTPQTAISARLVDEKREGDVFIVTLEDTSGKLKGKNGKPARAQGKARSRMGLGKTIAITNARANLAAGKFIN